MGSLTSTPKVPAQQQKIVYMPAPAASAQKITAPAPDIDIKEQTKEEKSKIRIKSLLARKRGRFGTIATSLRGFLGQSNPSKRKTLLGE